MIFKDRNEAAQLLASALEDYRGQDGIVVAIPRGGLPLGLVIATHLKFPLEVVMVKKIGHPSNKEFAMGSASLQSQVVGHFKEVSQAYLDDETSRLRQILTQRDQMYHRNHAPLSFKSKTVIVTDDGVATGRTLLAAIEEINEHKPKKIIVAVPVAHPSALIKIKPKIDELICLNAPWDLTSVSKYYHNFREISDSEAVGILENARQLTSNHHEKKSNNP